jgi:hypothetical protein
MNSQTDISNVALTMLGLPTINAVSDQSNPARTLAGIWNVERDNELRARVWKFAIRRTTLPLLSQVPASGPFNLMFALPQQCLRILLAGNSYPGGDISDLRYGELDEDYALEGNNILTNLPAPLWLTFILQVTDPTQWDPCFSKMFACRLAMTSCFRLTNSMDMKKTLMQEYKEAQRDALRANAFETTPQYPADDSWVSSRMGGAGAPGAAKINY